MTEMKLGADEVLKVCARKLEALSSFGMIPIDSLIPIIVALLDVLQQESAFCIDGLRQKLAERSKQVDSLHKEYLGYKIRNPEK